MAEVYMKDKPEAESFAYAYVEDSAGKLVRISLANLKEVIRLSEAPISVNLDLLEASWVASSDGTYYTQSPTIEAGTANSKVDLNPTPEQIIELMLAEITIFIANNNGVFTAYAVNGKPANDMTIEAIITEVETA